MKDSDFTEAKRLDTLQTCILWVLFEGLMKTILSSMRDRMPWSIASAIIKSVGLSPSQGWEKTIERLKVEEFDGFKGKLLDAIEEHNLCGEKLTKIYEIGADKRLVLQDHILGLEPKKEGQFQTAYPLTVPAAEINNVTGDPELVAIIKNDDGVGAIYSSAIFITKREKIDLSEYSAGLEELRKQYDEFIGLKNSVVQLFNVVWVPHDGANIEIRTDLPDGMPMDVAHAVQSRLRRVVNDFGKVTISDPIDLFPLLEKIYGAPEEGVVVELGFSTTSASVKHEKMRKNGLDLRTEPYHIAGKVGLGTPIEPFRLSVVWYLPHDDKYAKPELSLIGTARGRSTNKNHAVAISGAIIRNCAGRSEYEFVIERMRHHLNTLEDEEVKSE